MNKLELKRDTLIKSCWLVFKVTSMLMMCIATSYASEQKVIKVGVLAVRGEMKTLAIWTPTAEWLTNNVKGETFKIVPLNIDEVQESVKNRKVDFLITNAAQSVFLGRKYSTSWLATMKSGFMGGSLYTTGSTVIVKSDSTYRTISDLKNTKISLLNIDQVGGHTLIRSKFMRVGIDVDTFFSQLISPGSPADLGVYMLMYDIVDTAVIPVCLLETMDQEGFINIDDFRVLEQKSYPGFPCAVSTKLFPNWSFVRLPWGDPEVAKDITQSLLAMPSDSEAAVSANSSGWSIPISQKEVEDILFDLEVHPYHETWWDAAYAWFLEEWEILVTISMMFMGFIIYSVIREILFIRSRERLLSAEKALSAKSLQLARQERLYSVSELGASIAHEINQPLTSICNFSQLGEMKSERNIEPAVMKELFEKITIQAEYAAKIISTLRSRIHQESQELQEVDIQILMKESIDYVQSYKPYDDYQICLVNNAQRNVVELEAVGIKQVTVNLLKNAIESCIEKQGNTEFSPVISLSYWLTNDELIFEVRDNGVGIDSELGDVFQLMNTTKKTGMGLGLKICKDIVERNKGGIVLISNEVGCSARVTIPVW